MTATAERLEPRVPPFPAFPAWLEQAREEARRRFEATGFPTTREEDWRFTPLAPVATGEFLPPPVTPPALTAEVLARFTFGHSEWPRIVFVDGRFVPALSQLPAAGSGSVEVMAVAEGVARRHPALERHLTAHALPERTPFVAWNTCRFEDGALVFFPRGATGSDPVQVVHLATGQAGAIATHPRLLVVVDAGARGALVESYVTLAPGARYLTNAVTEVVLGDGAWLEHARIQRESEGAFHLGFTGVSQARDSHYRSFTLAMGGALARHDLQTRLNAPAVETLLYGLYLTHGEQLVDHHTAIHHQHPHCNSWEVYKGVLEDRSRAVFNGKVFVTPEAQKTDAKQTNRNLLLSDQAKVDTKPQLEIFADDVKCTHGATVGQLDALPLFYAQSRGLPADVARALLTYAFAAEVLDEIAVAPVREELDRLVHARLAGSV